MLVLTRAIGVMALLGAFASCDWISERKLVGAWRAEKDGAVDEWALHPDHTLIWWMCPAELSTPQTFVSTGKWHVRRNVIEMDTKLLTSPAPPEHHSFQILKLSDDSLLAKQTKEGITVTFHTFDLPTCAIPQRGAALTDIEQNILGVWQVHYHTHDFQYRFASDHTVAVSGKVSDAFEPLWKGSWSVVGGDLLMDLKPDSKYMGEQKPHWTLHNFQHDCFTIKDREGISYAVHRVQ
jgi:hypothetical protein